MLDLPEHIGRFTIIERLGSGGMGTVYLARDPDIGRQVAIKILHGTSDESTLKRFRNEARTIGELAHPNIVVLLEYGIEEDRPYLVMEYLDGVPLCTWLEESHTLEEHRAILLGICDALNYSHHKQILHRDLKPGNVQVLPNGQPKLLDFGIARAQGANLTTSGIIIGTPKFLAPEALFDGEHTAASDCYSLGLIAYTMLSGFNPFEAPTFHAVMARMTSITPALLHELNPAIPQKLSRVIARYLEKDPDKRPSSAEDLKSVLEQITSAGVLRRKIEPSPNCHPDSAFSSAIQTKTAGHSRWLWAAMFTLVALAIGFGAAMRFDLIDDVSPPKTEMNDATSRLASSTATGIQSPVTPHGDSMRQEPVITRQNELKRTQAKGPDEPPTMPALTTAVETTARMHNTPMQPAGTQAPPAMDLLPVEARESGEPVAMPASAQPSDAVGSIEASPRQTVEKPAAQKPKTMVAAGVKTKQPDLPPIQAHLPATKGNITSQAIDKGNKKTSPPIKITTLPPIGTPPTTRMRLQTIGNASISRGKIKKLVVEGPPGTSISKFKIFHGATEADRIHIQEVTRLDDGRIQLLLYSEPTTVLGYYTLVGIHDGKMTLPITLEVTL